MAPFLEHFNKTAEKTVSKKNSKGLMKKAIITRRGVILSLSAICLLFLAVVVLKELSQRFQNGMESAGPDASRNARWDAGMQALKHPIGSTRSPSK